jgi:hypothetical protein
MIFGVQCEGGCVNNNPADTVAAISASAFLTRVPILTPFYNMTQGTVFLANQNTNAGSAQVYVAGINGVSVGDLFYGPAWPDEVIATVVGTASAPSPSITFDTPTAFYIHAGTNRFQQIPQLQAAGIPYWAQLFNVDGPSSDGVGPILTSTATWRNQIVFTVEQMLLTGAGPIGLGCENEEDGNNQISNPGPPPQHSGDSSTIPQYLQKLGIVADVAQQFGIPSMDSGTTANGLQLATWFWLFYTIGTAYSRAQADAFVEMTFSKSLGQFDFAGDLPTSANPLGLLGDALFCGSISDDILTVTDVLTGSISPGTGASSNLFGPGVSMGMYYPPMSQQIIAQIDGNSGGRGRYQVSIPQDVPPAMMSTASLSGGRLQRIQKVNQILAGLGQSGTTYNNGHLYEIITESVGLIMQYMNTLSPKPLVAGEIGIYSMSAYDVIAKMMGSQWLGLPYIFWWCDAGQTQENGGNVSLLNPDGSLRNSGIAYKSYATTGQPKIAGTPGFPLAINPTQVLAA